MTLFEHSTSRSDQSLAIDWEARLPGTWLLVTTMCLVHVGATFVVGGGPRSLVFERSMSFRTQVGGQAYNSVDAGEIWRLGSSVLLHVDGLHLLFNLIAVFALGRVLEPWVGGLRTWGWFCAGGLFASLGSHLAGIQASDGASGGVFALLGVLLVLGLGRRFPLEDETAVMLKGPVRWIALFNLLLPLFVPFLDGVGHVSGLLAGVVLFQLSLAAPLFMSLVGYTAIGLVLGASCWGLGFA